MRSFRWAPARRRSPQPMGRRYSPRAPVRAGPVQPRPTVMLSGAYLDLVRDEITPVRSDMTRAPHRVHQGAAGQLDRRAVVGVVVSQVQAAAARAGGFQVGGHALAVERRVAGVQQRGPDAPSLL